ncbi:MAG: hypothetical protein IPP57_25125 [Candidatus Obscuribacter sp.]|nr:hypothetical protein [Candidatus Obscuribacter sp.]
MQKETQTKPTTPLAVAAATTIAAQNAAPVTAPIDGQKQSPSYIAKGQT